MATPARRSPAVATAATRAGRRGLPVRRVLACAIAGAVVSAGLARTFVAPQRGPLGPRRSPVALRAEEAEQPEAISEEEALRQDLELRVRKAVDRAKDAERRAASLEKEVASLKANSKEASASASGEVQAIREEKSQLQARMEAAEKRAAELETILKSLGSSVVSKLGEAGVVGDPSVEREAALKEAAASEERASESDREKEEALAKLQDVTTALEASEERGSRLTATEQRAERLSKAFKQIADQIGTSGGGLFSIFQAPTEEEIINSTLKEIKKINPQR